MNQKLKRAAALGMSFVMMFSIAGCKKGDSEKDTKDDKKSESSAEYGYNVEYEELKDVFSMGYSVQLGNTLYFTDYQYDEEAKKSTTSLKSLDISSPGSVKTYASYENVYVEDADVETFTDIEYPYPNDDGSVTYFKMDRTYSMSDYPGDSGSIDLGDIPEDAMITEEYIQQLNIDLSSVGLEFSEISTMTVKQVVDLYQQLTSEGGSESDESYENVVATLITVDADGKEVSSKDVTEQMKDTYISYSTFDKDGNLYIAAQQWNEENPERPDTSLVIFNMSTQEIETIKIDVIEFQDMVSTQNGDIVAVILDEEYNCSVVKWDKEKKQFTGEEDSSLSAMWLNDIYPADGDNFYYIYEGLLYKYDMKQNKDEQVLKFMDCNISADEIVYIGYVDEEHINVITRSNGPLRDSMILNKLTRVKASEIAKKTEITLGCLGASQSVERAIVEFNKTSSDYKIVIKEYLDYSDEDFDYDTAMTKFNNDVLSGNGPDLIDLSSMDFSQYKGSGLFADIYEYIKKDADFSNKNLNENILKLFEQDGKLLALPISYTITALASAKSILGDSPLTIDKFAEIIANNPDKDMFDSYISQEMILQMLLLYNENYFVDYQNKTCNFTDGNFEKLLNIAKTFPTEQELESVMPGDENDYDVKRVYEGRQLFYQLNMYDPNEYQIAKYILKDDINISGYPSVEGNSISAYVTSDLFAINSKSEYKDDCWNFIKILSDKAGEYGYYNGFPVDNDKLDELLKQYSTPNMTTDENGNEVEQPNIYGYNDMEIEIYALTEEQVNTIKELTKSVSVLTPQDYSGDLFDIINEESASFFSGEKSAADVCSVIQSRINIKINEDS